MYTFKYFECIHLNCDYMSNNALKGYTCKSCATHPDYMKNDTTIKTPLYRRERMSNGKYQFTFSGYVDCPKHGPSKAVALKDVDHIFLGVDSA